MSKFGNFDIISLLLKSLCQNLLILTSFLRLNLFMSKRARFDIILLGAK